eukprot:COSAG02_NODE_1998_length_10148_cov_30.517663_8_plen_136_part_00
MRWHWHSHLGRGISKYHVVARAASFTSGRAPAGGGRPMAAAARPPRHTLRLKVHMNHAIHISHEYRIISVGIPICRIDDPARPRRTGGGLWTTDLTVSGIARGDACVRRVVAPAAGTDALWWTVCRQGCTGGLLS